MQDDKWGVFKNYMHNELGIGKDDIRNWVKEAVSEQVTKLVNNEFEKFSVEDTVRKIVQSDRYWGNASLKREVIKELAEQLMEHVTIK